MGVTLRDVAQQAGVSPMTVSKALHGKPGVKASTREKVMATAKRLGYQVNLGASILRTGRSGIIHVVINEFDSPFYAKFTQALTGEISSRGLTPFVENTCYSPAEARRALVSAPLPSAQLFDGEILHASGLGHNAPISRLTSGRPFVIIDACESQPTCDQVNFPNEEGARVAIRHLIQRGCRRIALVGNAFQPRVLLDRAADSGMLRLRGASGALLDAGLEYSESVVFPAYDNTGGIAAGHAIAAANTADPMHAFDGVCCVNDYTALGAIRGLADAGLKVPDDLKVIGFDGVSAGTYAVPTLTTIQIDFAQLARLSVDMLVRRIERRIKGDDEEPCQSATIGFNLLESESTAIHTQSKES